MLTRVLSVSLCHDVLRNAREESVQHRIHACFGARSNTYLVKVPVLGLSFSIFKPEALPEEQPPSRQIPPCLPLEAGVALI